MLVALPMAVAIALSPFAIIPAIVLLLTPRPREAAGAFLAGWVLGVALVAGLLLTYAYVAIAGRRQVRLLAQREVDARNKSKEERDAQQAALEGATKMEAVSYALFLVNGIYVVRACAGV